MDLNDYKGSCTRFLPRILREFAHSLEGRIVLIYTHIFSFNIYHVIREVYQQKYKIPNHEEAIDWKWRDLPRMPLVFYWYRVVNTIYLVYVVIKYTMPKLVRFILANHCYILGRFIIYEQVREVCATCWACFHLVWRLFIIFDYQPLAIGTFYFLILDDHDIQLYYKLLDHDQAFRIVQSDISGGNSTSLRELQQRDARLNMMHDIMSFRIDHNTGIIFKLRPNRSPEACRKLRSFLIIATLIAIMAFALIVPPVLSLMLILVYDDRTYLREYPNCDARLEQMKTDGLVTPNEWSFHLTCHRVWAVLFDHMENFFLWVDSALVLYSCIVCTLLLNYDLDIYWSHLSRNIELLLRQAKMMRTRRRRHSLKAELAGQRRHEESIYELQMEIRDFMMSVRRADQLIGDCLTTIICVWFTLFAYFIYETILRNGRHVMPIALNLTLIAVLFLVTFMSMLVISVHRNCLKSYAKICSLMALDTSPYKKHFMEILDFFHRRRTCCTIFRRYEMTTTTYLTIIGYSFSCFFILGSVGRKR